MKTHLFSSLVLIILLFSFPAITPAQKPVTVAVRSTSLVERTDSGERQVCRATVGNAPAGAYDLELTLPGRKGFSTILEGLGVEPLRFGIPVLTAETPARVVVRQAGIVITDTTVTLTPPKKWTVYDVQVSHHDLGYADYYHMMRRDVREWGIELALENCRQTDEWPKESRFHWTVETSEPMTGFLQYQPDSVINELTRRIREGRIELGGLHNSVSTEHMSYEALARAFYTPNRHIVDWLDIPPAKTALDTDVVGFVRSLPLYTKEADIPYFMMGINSTVIAFDQAYRDAAWYWKAQDNDPKMTLFKTWPYYSPDRLMAYDPLEIGDLIDRYESRSDYPYDGILAEDSYDFGLPEMSNVQKIKAWNGKFSNPVLVSGTFSMFFEHIASQKDLREFTIYSKDAPNAWADEDLADARLEGEARKLGYRIPEMEKLATLVTAVGGGCYPWSDLYQAYNRLLMYHEHTNGAYAEGPIYVPPSLSDSSAANANYYEVEQEMHRSLVSESRDYLDRAEKKTSIAFKSLIPTGAETTLAVYNSLNYTRTDVVTFPDPAGLGSRGLYDNTTGKPVACQQWPDGTLFFLATDIPQAGYKTYSLRPGRDTRIIAAQAAPGDQILENGFYRLVFNPLTGGILSIFDKYLNRELVDQAAPTSFNEYLYQRYESTRYSPGLVSYKPTHAELTCFRGSLASMMESKVQAVGCESITQRVILYEDIRRIDFVLQIDKSPSGRSLEDYRQGNARNKEALFYCLPFSVPDFTIRHELPGAVVEPIKDQFEGSSTDYYGIQHFTDLSNDEFGITLATIEAPLVEYGNPRPASWGRGDDYEHIMKKPAVSRVYLYLLNNMFFTNIRMSQPGSMTFHWSVRSHAGDWKQGQASRFGWEISHPLEPMIIPPGNRGILPANRYSFFETDRENVVCTTVKAAEANGSGIICRFFELTGEETTVHADMHFAGKIRKAVATNLVESDRNEQVTVTHSNRLTFTLPPHGIKTIRIEPLVPFIDPVLKLKAQAISDRQIRLTWEQPIQGAGEVAYYKIFRSKDPQVKPHLRNLVGTAGQTTFIDEPVLNYGGWINNYVEPETSYFYCICPVSKKNILGPVSQIVKSQTLSSQQKDLPPAKIEGLRVVHVSPITHHNYLCLFFYSSIESDVTRYLIYRSPQAGFKPSENNLIGEINAGQRILHTTPHGFRSVERSLSEFTQQMFADEPVEPNVRYYYRICAVDRSGNRSEPSAEVSGKAVLSQLTIEGMRFFFAGGTEVSIRPAFKDGSEVRYTLDGSEPSLSSELYTGPLTIARASRLQAVVFYPGSVQPSARTESTFTPARYPAPGYLTSYAARWAGTGVFNLVDGQKGEFWNDGFWQGFEYVNLDVVVDLSKITRISEISLGTFQYLASWIFLPEEVEFFLSADGNQYHSAGKVSKDPVCERIPDISKEYTITFEEQEVRFVRVVAKNKAICPDWHVGAGGKAWIFADEVTVR